MSEGDKAYLCCGDKECYVMSSETDNKDEFEIEMCQNCRSNNYFLTNCADRICTKCPKVHVEPKAITRRLSSSVGPNFYDEPTATTKRISTSVGSVKSKKNKCSK